MPETTENPVALPPPPRAITPRAKRRSWAESPVRIWVVLTVLVGASLIALTAQNINEGLIDHRLIYSGVATTAKVTEINGSADPRMAVAMHGATEDRTVGLSYQDQKGTAVQSAPRALENPRNDGARVGGVIAIHYDPDHPEVWTDRVNPQPWIARLAIVWMLLPALFIAVGMMIVRRQQMLRIWRDGEEVIGTVVELRQSAIAPRSRVMRFTLDDSGNRRIHSTFFPNDAAEIHKGDEVVMLMLPWNPSRVIVAELYEM